MAVTKTNNSQHVAVQTPKVAPKTVGSRGSAAKANVAQKPQVARQRAEQAVARRGGRTAGVAGRFVKVSAVALTALAKTNPVAARAKLANQFNAYTAHATMNSAGKIVSNAEPSTDHLINLIAELHGEGLTHIYRNLDTPDHVSGDFRALLEDRSSVKVDLAVNQVVKRGERLAADRVVQYEIPTTVDESGEIEVDDDAFWAMYDARVEASPIADSVFNEISDQLLLGNLEKAGMLA